MHVCGLAKKPQVTLVMGRGRGKQLGSGCGDQSSRDLPKVGEKHVPSTEWAGGIYSQGALGSVVANHREAHPAGEALAEDDQTLHMAGLAEPA